MEYVTDNPSANEQLLYFTSSSLSYDDRRLYYLSDAGGHPNVWMKDLKTGESRRLTHNAAGAMKSYVYFRGAPYRGLGKASMSLDERRDRLYYIMDHEIRRASPGGEDIALNALPPGQMTAFTHVSADGRYLCVPTTDKRALEDEDYLPETPDGCGNLGHDIDQRVQNEGLCSYLNVYDTETGERVLSEKVERAWITHVQFSPVDSGAILYNHEWPADCGIRRMWLYQDGRHTRLRREGGGRRKEDWTCHEMWYPDGRGVLYHGGYADGPYYIGRVGLAGTDNIECALPASYTAYGHFTMGNAHPDWLATDGYYVGMRNAEVGIEGDPSVKEDGEGGFICAVKVDWRAGTMLWTPLCKHNSPWTTQDTHPHPIFDHADKYIYFTGHDGGKLRVCRVISGI